MSCPRPSACSVASIAVTAGLLLALPHAATAEVVVSLPFTSTASLASPLIEDLSRLPAWNNGAAGTSMFTVAADPFVPGRQSLQITPQALGIGNIPTNFGWTALDVRLPQRAAFASNVVTISFQIRYNSIFDSSNGERNRTLIALVDNYPTQSPTYTAVTPISPGYVPGTYPYGTPTYHLRIRPGIQRTTSFLQYGGAVTVNGVNYQNSFEFNSTQWYPGFNAVPGPAGVASSPGLVPDYPLSGEVTTLPVFQGLDVNTATANVWEFRYVISPTAQSVYNRIINPALPSAEQANPFTLLGTMPLPLVDTAPGASNYQGFDAIRLYFNNNPGRGTGFGVGADSNTYLNNFEVDVSRFPYPLVPEPSATALATMTAAAILHRRPHRCPICRPAELA